MAEAEQQEIDDELEEIKRLLDNKDAANTKRITKLAYNVFSSVVDVATAEKVRKKPCKFGQTPGEILRNCEKERWL